MDRASKIREVAARLNMPPQWLDMVIAFESRYDPKARSAIPYNLRAVREEGAVPRFARGLIQFIDSTAKRLGFDGSDDLVSKLPDFDSQMDGAVYPYFAALAPFVSEQDVCMAVFYPAYRRVEPTREFPDTVQAANPGIRTPQDYVDKVHKIVASQRLIPLAAGGAGLLLLVVAVWLMRG